MTIWKFHLFLRKVSRIIPRGNWCVNEYFEDMEVVRSRGNVKNVRKVIMNRFLKGLNSHIVERSDTTWSWMIWSYWAKKKMIWSYIYQSGETTQEHWLQSLDQTHKLRVSYLESQYFQGKKNTFNVTKDKLMANTVVAFKTSESSLNFY